MKETQKGLWTGGPEIEDGEAGKPKEKGERGKARVRGVNRGQMVFRSLKIDELVDEGHVVRGIWELVGRLDLTRYYSGIGSVEGEAGRPPWDPRVMISVWLYALSRGENRAREVHRLCGHDPAYQWLTGMQEINYHTLSDFRVAHKEGLEELFVEVLGVLSAEGLITLERVMHDGTKVRANASSDTFHREGTIRKHLAAARELVEGLEEEGEEVSRRVEARRARARRERQERLELALKELEKIREGKLGEEAKEESRVSETEPECRIMKQSDGGYGPSYNAQVSVDGANGIIVGAGVSQSGSDYGELCPSVERVKKNMERAPEEVVSDGGFMSRENILAMKREGIELIGPVDDGEGQRSGQLKRRGISGAYGPEAFVYESETDRYRCPMGKTLRYEGKEKGKGITKYIYRADGKECGACPSKGKCCPEAKKKGRRITRSEEAAEVVEFREKMKTEGAKAIYRERGPVSEFANAWLKEKIGLRRFRLRGLVKAGMELLWACLAHNIQQWIRLCWRRAQVAAA